MFLWVLRISLQRWLNRKLTVTRVRDYCLEPRAMVLVLVWPQTRRKQKRPRIKVMIWALKCGLEWPMSRKTALIWNMLMSEWSCLWCEKNLGRLYLQWNKGRCIILKTLSGYETAHLTDANTTIKSKLTLYTKEYGPRSIPDSVADKTSVDSTILWHDRIKNDPIIRNTNGLEPYSSRPIDPRHVRFVHGICEDWFIVSRPRNWLRDRRISHNFTCVTKLIPRIMTNYMIRTSNKRRDYMKN